MKFSDKQTRLLCWAREIHVIFSFVRNFSPTLEAAKILSSPSSKRVVKFDYKRAKAKTLSGWAKS